MPISRIMLIEPRAPGRHVYSLVKMPRLGLPIIGTQLKKRGYEVKFIYGDLSGIKAADIIGADLVGISTTTSTCYEAYKIAGYCRQKGVPVVLGGVHASFVPQEAIQYCDYVCRGEADFSFADLVDCLNRNEAPGHIPGIYYWQDSKLIDNPWPKYPDMNDLPPIDTEFLESLGLNCYPVMTSRGCPYDCTFCSVTRMFGHNHRPRGLERALDDLIPYAGKKVFFCDDNFTARPRCSKEFLREMKRRNICPSWWGAQVRVDTARDEELLNLMRLANCRVVYVGMESINPRTLETYNKKQGVADIEHCIKTFHRYGMMVHGMFVLGSDEDDRSTVRETAEFTISSGLDTVQYLSLVPLPGTPLYEQLKNQDRLLSTDWRYYDGHHVVYRPKLMSPWELQDETMAAFERFYSPLRWGRGLSGKRNQAWTYRAAGFYLSRLYSRESRSWSQHLRMMDRTGPRPTVQVSRTLKEFTLKGFKYFSTAHILDVEVQEKKDILLIDLRGCLNKRALREVLATCKRLVGQYKELVINIGQLSFPSEDLLRSFIKGLDKISGKALRVKLNSQLSGTIMQMIEKDNLSLPNFEF